MMDLPTFIIVGTQRGGTTSLYHYLKQHPDVFMPEKKELHFFDLNWGRGIEWYKAHFRNAKKHKVVGEASPAYMYIEEVPKRIKKVVPCVKLIFILRNPVERAYSHYWHEVKLGYEYLSFEEAISKEKERLSKGDLLAKIHYSYLDRGKYAIQIKRFKKYFKEEQMLILLFDDLRKDPSRVLKRIFKFLGVNQARHFSIKQVYNVGVHPRFWILQRLRSKLPFKNLGFTTPIINPIFFKIGYPKMRPTTRKLLVDFFKDYNEDLEKILNTRLPSSWYQ